MRNEGLTALRVGIMIAMNEEPRREIQGDEPQSKPERKAVILDIGGDIFVSDTSDPIARWIINDIRLHQFHGPQRIRIHETPSGTIVVFPPDFRLPERLRIHAYKPWRPDLKQ